MTPEYCPGEPETWTWPDAYDCDPGPPTDNVAAGRDCLNCGTCEACIDRSAAFAAEMNDGWPDFDYPDDCPHFHGTNWQDCGIVAIECPECGGL